ncbi:prepilin-type N-terminal cleavage/methylation domain-containing protein [bacterium]|nr:prepilin-type N-terminal cleavage/methylation domain-containing protein [bacterium]
MKTLLKKSAGNQKGFTLIELVLTIVVVSILSVVAMPNFDTSAITLDSASRKILTDIRYAQNLSTTTLDAYGFRVTGATTYQIYKQSTGAVATNPITNKPMQYDLSTNFSGARFTNQNINVIFNAYGNPTSGGGTNITLSVSGTQKTISVSSTSGYVGLL